MDTYQVFFPGEETLHFWTELLESEFPVLVAVVFLTYGLVKNRDYRFVKIAFLVLSVIEGLVAAYWSYKWNGQTIYQVQAMLSQDSIGQYYLDYFFPTLVSCCTVMLTAISFQIKKPYYFSFRSLVPWQAILLRIMAVGFYLQVAWMLLNNGIMLFQKRF